MAGVGSNLRDYIILSLRDGRVVVMFNNNFGFEGSTLEGSTERLYNDGQIHRVQLTFQNSRVDLTVDGSREILLSGEKETCILSHSTIVLYNLAILNMLSLNLNTSVLGLMIRSSFDHPPTLWIGGIPSNLVTPSVTTEQDFSSFVGCMFSPAHTSSLNTPLRVFDPDTSTANM